MDQEKIGKFILKLRKDKNLTQQELAEKLGTTDKSVSRWENGKSMPDLSIFPVLSKELGVSVNDLMSGQIIEKKDYQDTFETNVVKTISNVDKANKKFNLIENIFVGIIALFALWFFGYIFYVNVEFRQKYNPNTMKIEKDESKYYAKIGISENLTFWSSEGYHIYKLFTTCKENNE